MTFRKTTLSTMILAAALSLSGAALASDKFFAAEGETTTYDTETEIPSEDPSSDYKLIGGWDLSQPTEGTSLEHADVNTDVTLTGNTFDELIGGNHMRNTKLEAPAQMSIGDTKVTITGGTLVYAIGGSKASTSGELTVENGNVQMAIGGETKITGKVIGGNYIKNSAATSSGAGAGKGTVSKSGNIALTIEGGSFTDLVIGGSFAENYTPANAADANTGSDMALTASTGHVGMTVTGGTFQEDVFGGSAAVGKNSAVTNDSSSLTISLSSSSVPTFTKDKRIVGGSYVAGQNATATTIGNTGVVIEGAGELSVSTNIVGGDLIEHGTFGADGSKSVIQGTSSVVLSASNFTTAEEIIGGSYVKVAMNAQDVKVNANVTNTRVDISAGTITGNVIGGGKVNLYANENTDTAGASASSDVGSANVVISGGKVSGAIIGGGSAKSRNGIEGHADVETVNISVTGDAVVGGVIGGGMAYNYDASNAATLTAKTTSGTTITVSNAKLDGFQYNSGVDATIGLVDTAIIAGGVAYDKVSSETKNTGLDASVGNTVLTVQNSEVSGNVYGGGYAFGHNAVAETASADMHFINSTVTGNVSTGGLTGENATSATVKTASIALENTTVSGALLLGGANTGTQGEKTGAEKVSSATFTGVNSATTVSGKADAYTFNATADNAEKAIFDAEGTLDATGSTVTVNNVTGHTVITGEKTQIQTDEATTMSVGTTFATTTYSLGSAGTLGQLTYTEAGLTAGDKLLAGTAQGNRNSKTLSETMLGSVAFVNQGAEFIADEGMDAISRAAKPGSFTAFGAMQGGRSTYETGSHVSVWGASLAAGTAGKVGNLTMAGFVEAGWGNSESKVSGASGDGDHEYYGLGGALRYEFENPFYVEGSLRFGWASTEFDGDYAVGNAQYDADSLYATAHVGGGYVFELTPSVSIDIYGRYMLTYLEGDEVDLHTGSGESLDMDDTTAHTVRVGFNLLGNYTKELAWHAGLAYEHVFDGDAESTVLVGGSRASLDTPTLEGNTGIADIGFTYQPDDGTSPWTFGINLKGYAGDRQGVTGSLNALYTF